MVMAERWPTKLLDKYFKCFSFSPLFFSVPLERSRRVSVFLGKALTVLEGSLRNSFERNCNNMRKVQINARDLRCTAARLVSHYFSTQFPS